VNSSDIEVTLPSRASGTEGFVNRWVR